MRNIVFYILVFLTFAVQAQTSSSHKTILLQPPFPDTLLLDTNTIDFSSLKIFCNGKIIDNDSIFSIDLNKHLIIFDKKELFPNEKIEISFRVMSVNLSKEKYHKSTSLLTKQNKEAYNPFAINTDKNESWLQTDGLNKDGNISRGFSIGNMQDASLSSSLNLLLSGKLNNDLNIQAVISDNNVPIQPEGNTQQIQEFDKIFISLQKNETAITAGDIVVNASNKSYFMKYSRKTQGGLVNTLFSPQLSKNDKMKISAFVSLAKGKYVRQSLTIIEGNQGPYKLKGNNNETFITILAGSEKIYLDGNILDRGQENNYTIDYNTAEITFTSKTPITANSRITAEFEYSDKNYSRSLIGSDINYTSGKLKAAFCFFSEKDMKNQSITQNLDNKQKMFLSLIGDSLQNALYSGVDSVEFSTDQILYAMVDSLGYDSVFVYSSNPDSAKYNLSFSNVGDGKGDYILSTNNANGRVYQWVAPIAGVKQGLYEPVIILITPKQQELYSLQLRYDFNKNTFLETEYALSRNDNNLFSKIDDNNNIGNAAKLHFNNTNKLQKDSTNSWQVENSLIVEFTQLKFEPIENYKSIEYNRDWNTSLYKENADEYFATLSILFRNKKNENFHLQTSALKHGNYAAASRNKFSFNKNIKKMKIYGDENFLYSPTKKTQSNFAQHKTGITQQIGSFLLGIEEQGEYNKIFDTRNDSLNNNSFSWQQAKTWIEFSDSSKVHSGSFFYTFRQNNIGDTTEFTSYSKSQDAGIEYKNNKFRNQSIVMRSSFRQVKYDSEELEDEHYLLGKIEYNAKLKKRFILFSSFYEIASGVEAEKEFYYLEVQQGQGVYKWIDENNNNIKDINEFQIAAFRDEANFIRVFVPTSNFVRVFTSQLSGNLTIDPNSILKKETIFGKIGSKIHNRTYFSFLKKSIGNTPNDIYQPIYFDNTDSSIISGNSNWRNVLSINKNSSKMNLSWTHQRTSNIGLLTNGIEQKYFLKNEIKASWNIAKSVYFDAIVLQSENKLISESYSSSNYQINERCIKPSISWQNNNTFRACLISQYSEKANKINNMEKAFIRKYGIEGKFSKANKGILQANFNILFINFSGEESKNTAYIMLDGLNSGQNITWSIAAQRYLGNNLQLNFTYEARAAKNKKVIHTGNIQLRAFF